MLSVEGNPAPPSLAPPAVRQAHHSRVQPPPAPVEPSPEERRIAAAYQREQEALLAPTGIRSGGAVATAQATKATYIPPAVERKPANYIPAARTLPLNEREIKAGWEIPAVLEQSLNSALPGEIKALVSANVFDTATGRYLLIPQGSRLVGKYESQIAYGQDGVQVVWSRIIFPDATSVDLGGMVGLDAHGNGGLRYAVDRHYKRLFGFAALTSAFAAAFDLSQRNTQSALTYPSFTDTASASIGREMSQTGAMITRRNLNVQPTIKVPGGYRFTVRVNRDLVFEAPYEPLEPNPLQPQPPGHLRQRAANN